MWLGTRVPKATQDVARQGGAEGDTKLACRKAMWLCTRVLKETQDVVRHGGAEGDTKLVCRKAMWLGMGVLKATQSFHLAAQVRPSANSEVNLMRLKAFGSWAVSWVSARGQAGPRGAGPGLGLGKKEVLGKCTALGKKAGRFCVGFGNCKFQRTDDFGKKRSGYLSFGEWGAVSLRNFSIALAVPQGLGNALQLDFISFGTNSSVVQKFSATPVQQDFPQKEGRFGKGSSDQTRQGLKLSSNGKGGLRVFGPCGVVGKSWAVLLPRKEPGRLRQLQGFLENLIPLH
ncbi:Hypothetical predicted protein [Prunus dulcis]|uniref:Uncharacterized protein n=1 Tax=Prunus dulcis TaxID=3755 RepID=A0A5E4GJ31_PRUDU|nr:Hypothetical predicted protein [Prunus dulcis]